MAKKKPKLQKRRTPDSDCNFQLFPCPHLESSLQAWEDLRYWIFAIESISHLASHKLDGYRMPINWIEPAKMKNSERFRKYILSIHQQDPDLQKIEDFNWSQPVSKSAKWMAKTASWYKWLHLELAKWNLDSRRIYRLSDELQAVLEATSLGDITWEDLELPFESYAIELPRPLKLLNGAQIDFILMTREQGQYVLVKGFCRDLVSYIPSKNELKMRVNDLKVKNEFDGAARLAQEELNRISPKNVGLHFMLPVEKMDFSIRDSFMKAYKYLEADESTRVGLKDSLEEKDIFELVIGIAVGLALYLKTVRSPESVKTPWKQETTKGKGPSPAITNGCNICSVMSAYKLSKQERLAYGLDQGTEQEKAEFMAIWQFVSGHWKRKRGLGQDPAAPKTEHILPYMRRKDLMPDGLGLPSGANQEFQ